MKTHNDNTPDEEGREERDNPAFDLWSDEGARRLNEALDEGSGYIASGALCSEDCDAYLDAEDVRETFKAIRREIGTKHKIKPALLTQDVRKIVACCPDNLAGKRDKALYLVSFAEMLRREDSAALLVEGLQFTSEGLVMMLDHGKTDQESRGREIAIVPGVDPTTCPLRGLRDWLDAAKISSGPVFRGVDQKGRVSPSGLHRDSIGYIIKRAAAHAGMNVAGIAGHSLRSGGITTAAGNGVPEYIIRRQ